MVSLRKSGAYLLRRAARHRWPLLFQEPPRSTFSAPLAGPAGVLPLRLGRHAVAAPGVALGRQARQAAAELDGVVPGHLLDGEEQAAAVDLTELAGDDAHHLLVSLLRHRVDAEAERPRQG